MRKIVLENYVFGLVVAFFAKPDCKSYQFTSQKLSFYTVIPIILQQESITIETQKESYCLSACYIPFAAAVFLVVFLENLQLFS